MKSYVYTEQDLVKVFGRMPKCHHMQEDKLDWNCYECSALVNKKCDPHYCTFYQTEKDWIESRKKCNHRLLSLPKTDLDVIAGKYYAAYPERWKKSIRQEV